MKLFVSRNGQTFGPYSLVQAKEFLASNQLLSTDFALVEGTSDWNSLEEVIKNAEQQQVVHADPRETQVQKDEISLDSRDKAITPKVQKTEGKISQKEKSAKSSPKVQKIKKAKGGQIIVVAQEKSFLSKIFSTIFVLIFLFLLAAGAIVGAYFAMPSKMGPIFARFGFELDGNLISAPSVEDHVETKNPEEIMLSEDAWNTLRSSGIKILPMVGKKGVQVISSVDPELAMKDEDLEKLLIIAPHIVSLDLTDSKITNSGFDHISKMSNLNKLLLEGVDGINADGLIKLKELANLEHLNLIRVKLESAAINALISLESLRELYLFESGLKEEEISKLKSARPKVFVNSG